MPTSHFRQRFRLPSRQRPKHRPKCAPFGYLDGIGSLSKSTLWIDGWLTLDPVDRLEVEVELAGRSVRGLAECIQGQPVSESDGEYVRYWIILLPVGEGCSNASRARNVTLHTESGSLLWLGGFDRLVSPDIVARFRQPQFTRDLLEVLHGILSVRHHETADDPILFRNIEAFERRLEPHTAPPARTRREYIEALPAAEEFGKPIAEPEASLVLLMLQPPDLLEHHFPQLERSRSHERCEIILALNESCNTPYLAERIRDLVDLYGVSVKVVQWFGPPRWATAAMVGAHHARSDRLVFLHGHTICFDPKAMEQLWAPLAESDEVGVTFPVVENFDRSVRSAGFHVDLVNRADHSSGIRRLAPKVTQIESGIVDACGSDCLAIRRSLFVEMQGFSELFVRPDYETLDFCLRARAKGFEVRRIGVSVTRFLEGTSPPPLPREIPEDRLDLRLWAKRRPHYEAFAPDPQSASEDGPEVTVVIPTLDPGDELVEVLDRLEAQENAPPFEIFVIDSSSRDGTLDILRQRGVRHQVIEKEDFNHGLTRNLGVREARGEIVAFLSQDALPEPGWLAGLVAGFREPVVVGCYGRQIPRPDASHFVRAQLSRWPASSPEPRRQEIRDLEFFLDKPLDEKLRQICFDNVSSAVRRSVALRFPFRDLCFGEDRDWAYRVLASGFAIEYRPDSRVIHSHERSPIYHLRRVFMDHRLIRDLLEPSISPSWSESVDAIRTESSRLVREAADVTDLWERTRARLVAPIRALTGIAGAHLAIRSAHQVASGSHLWRWITSRLARGV